MNRSEAYQQVTARIVSALEAGTVPWRKPWRCLAPRSVHGHFYRGVNQLLAFAPYASPVWLTFNQARELGGSVRKGEKGWKVLLWKVSNRQEAGEGSSGPTDENGRRFFATTYTVFNLEQCDGVTLPAKLAASVAGGAADPIASAESIVNGFTSSGGPSLRVGPGASYSSQADRVTVPPMVAFDSPELYYSTLFHELTHSTGHPSRLDREQNGIGDEYAQEGLVAELGAAFLASAAGIENRATLGDSASYIAFWLRKFRDDGGKSLVQAASAAQKAADLILGARAAEESEAA